MLEKLRPKLTYANVVSTVALLIVLGGGVAYAEATITGRDIVDGSLTGVDYHDESITAGKLKPGAVGTTRLANASVTGSKLHISRRGNYLKVPGGAAENGRWYTRVGFAKCFSDEMVLTGSATWLSAENNQALAIVESGFDTETNAWRVRAANDSGTDETLLLIALCLPR